MAENRIEMAHCCTVLACPFEFCFLFMVLLNIYDFVEKVVAVIRLVIYMVMRYDVMQEDHHPCQQDKISFYFKSFSQPDYYLILKI